MPQKLLKTLTLALPLASVGLLGCEERVIGVQNSWGGSTIDRLEREREQEQSGKHLENMGDFLFGWIDDVSGKPKPPTAREYIP